MRGKITAGVVGGLIAGLIAWQLVGIIGAWGTWPLLVTTPVFREVGPLAALLVFWGLGLFLALKAPRTGKAWRRVLVMCAILFFAAHPTGFLTQTLAGVLYILGGPILGVIALLVAWAAGVDADKATSLNNQGLLSHAQGFYEEAESLFLQALAIREKKLGSEHAGVATILNNLAETYQAQGRYTEAEPLYKRALAIREKGLQPFHPDVDRGCDGRVEKMKVRGWEIFCITLAAIWFIPVALFTLVTIGFMSGAGAPTVEVVEWIISGLALWLIPTAFVYFLGAAVRGNSKGGDTKDPQQD